MFSRFGPNYMAVLYLLDLGCGLLALRIAQDARWSAPTPLPGDPRTPPLVFGLVVALFGTILPAMGLYDPRRVVRAAAEVQRVVLGVTTSSVLLAGMLFLTYRTVPRLMFGYFVVTALLLLLSHRGTLRVLYRVAPWTTRAPVALVVGTGPLGIRTAGILAAGGVKVTGLIDDASAATPARVDGHRVLAGCADIAAAVERHGVTDVVFALPGQPLERLTPQLVSLWRLPVRVYTIPDFFHLGFARIRVDYLGGLAMVGLREPAIDGFQRVAKRLIDVAVGTVIFLVALPVMACLAVAIRLDSPGPVLFKQQRVGENGRLFTMYKFRTMVADAEQQQARVNVYTAAGQVVHKRADDPRVTRLGRVLRRLSLDELPQLINVLRGEMSLVGPRPELPWIVATYRPWQYQRLTVPPGMTSWYVVNGRSEIPMHLNTEEDLRYVHHYSIFEDLKILWQSLGTVVKGRGAF